MNRLFTPIFLFIFSFAFAQQPEIFKLKKYEVAQLSDTIQETSALHFFRGHLLTLNDSGNTPEIFEISKKSGKILNSVKTALTNKDWEAITSDSLHVFVGDFGNNRGTRNDLKIYKIPFDGKRITDSVQTISFYYPEQTDFTSRNTNNDFDAEAMIFLNGKIHLFTKEWVSKKTTHYIINPDLYQNQPAQKVETLPTGYVVTDASYFRGNLYLVGYTKKTEVFLSIYKETAPGFFFNENPRKYYLGTAISVGQIEGIAVNEDGIYISGEAFKSPLGKVPQSFYFIPKSAMPTD